MLRTLLLTSPWDTFDPAVFGQSPLHQAEDEEVAFWDDVIVEGDDDWAWGLCDKEADDWDFP